MALKTGSIYHPREAADGFRISVSRHTCDGFTLDPKITHASYDAWWMELAPPPSLVGARIKRGLSWERFEQAFDHYLLSPEAHRCLLLLAEISRDTDVTISCVCETPEECHRRLVAEACRRIDPSLHITIE